MGFTTVRIADPGRVLAILVAAESALALVYLSSEWLGRPITTVHDLFDMDGEGNIPAWFSSVQLFAIGCVFLLRHSLARPGHAVPPLFWFVLAMGFFFLSADEAASIHERLTYTLRQFEWLPRFKGGHGIWIGVYALGGFMLVACSLRPLRALLTHHPGASRLLVLGLAIVVLGSVGLEIVGYQFLRSDAPTMLYAIEVALEEFLEMFGASVVLCGALMLLREEPASLALDRSRLQVTALNRRASPRAACGSAPRPRS